MKKRVRENLSAYLDGEAKDASAIARLIAESPEAAQEHIAYAELSARLRNLAEPDMHPAFAARIVATIKEQEERRPARWRVPASIGVAAAALLVAALTLQSRDLRTTPTIPQTASITAPAAQSEDALMAELERRVSQDSDLQHFVLARFENAPKPEKLYSDQLISAIAGSPGASAAGGAFAYGVDYRAAVQRLDDAQANALKEILAASMREAQEG